MKAKSPGTCAKLQFDPRGPEETKLPRGRFTFAHLTLTVLGVAVAVLVVLAVALG
jgi:hypothetical protein